MNPGLFITIEGIEGVGKTTALNVVVQWLRDQGQAEVLATREPGGTALGESLRGLLLDPGTGSIAPLSELLIIFAARAQHLDEIVRPQLARGATVVCDRFTDASYAYQGYGRGLPESVITATEAIVHPGLEPFLTLLLDAPPELALSRARARGTADRFERERVEFFERVRHGYLVRAQMAANRFVIVDASQEIELVHARIREILARRCL
jgi:dTMP kinase